MGFLFSGLVWGAFFILLGLAVILKFTLNIDIPVIRLFFAFFLIYLGIQVLLGGFRKQSCAPNVIFDQGKVAASGKEGQYNVIFGKGVIDLTGVELKDKDVTVEANTIFGASTLKISSGVPTLVKANAAFGNAKLPDGNAAAVGTCFYKNKAYEEGKPCVTVNANVVFGEIEIIEP